MVFFAGIELVSAKHCYAIFEVGDTSFCSSLPINAELFFNDGDPINILASTVVYGNYGMCATCTTLSSFWNGNSMFNFMITDTGLYTASAYSDDGCFGDFAYLRVHISYSVPTDVKDLEEVKYLVYPSLSHGIFNVEINSKKLKELIITDCSGKTVIYSSNEFLQFDLTDFPSGIYLYAIKDERESVFRGRIVKE